MADHYHLLTFFKNASVIPTLLKQINGRCAYYYNHLTGNKKSLWGEYHVLVISEEQALAKVRRYITGNPLKHGDIKTLKELETYPFSSYATLVNNEGSYIAKETVRSVITLEPN